MNLEDLYRLLRTGHMEALGVIDTVDFPMLVLDPAMHVRTANRAFFQTFRVERYDTLGKSLYELGDGQWNIPQLRLLLEAVIPKSAAVINYQVDAEFPGIGRRTMLLTGRTLLHPDNLGQSIVLTFVDATDAKRRDAAKDLVLGELRHRMKNLLAVIRMLAAQTSTQGRTAEQYRDAFLGRLDALLAAEDLAFTDAPAASLKTAIDSILGPFAVDPAAVMVECPHDVTLDARTIQPLSLILHELATNAVKYGALSVPGGRVQLSAVADNGAGRLRLKWVESGGPPVRAPATTGYGTKLIRSAATYGMGGEVQHKYLPGGLQSEIVLPLPGAAHT